MQTTKCDISIKMITLNFGLVNSVILLISFAPDIHAVPMKRLRFENCSRVSHVSEKCKDTRQRLFYNKLLFKIC